MSNTEAAAAAALELTLAYRLVTADILATPGDAPGDAELAYQEKAQKLQETAAGATLV